MKLSTLKIALTVVVSSIAFLLFAITFGVATASEFYEATYNGTNENGNVAQTFNTEQGSTWPGGVNYGKTFGYISRIDVYISATENAYDNYSSYGVTLQMVRGSEGSSGTATTSINTITLGEMGRGVVGVESFYFNEDQIDFSTDLLKAITIDLGLNGDRLLVGKSSFVDEADVGNEYEFRVGGTEIATSSWAMIIYDELGVPIGGTIEFDSGNFRDGMETFDFQHWNLIVVPETTGDFDLQVKWGTSTPDTYQSDWTDVYPRFHMREGETYHIPLPKQSTSTPDTYVAQGHLYSWNGTSYDLVASTDELTLTIVAGDIIREPPYFYTEELVGCQETTFQYVGVDFGKGICEVARFLFVPSDMGRDFISQSTDNLMDQYPFKFFTDIKDILSDPTVSTTTPLSFTYTASSSPVGNLNIDIASTTQSFLGSSTYNFLINAMGYVIWFIVGLYVYFRLTNFF